MLRLSWQIVKLITKLTSLDWARDTEFLLIPKRRLVIWPTYSRKHHTTLKISASHSVNRTDFGALFSQSCTKHTFIHIRSRLCTVDLPAQGSSQGIRLTFSAVLFLKFEFLSRFVVALTVRGTYSFLILGCHKWWIPCLRQSFADLLTG